MLLDNLQAIDKTICQFFNLAEKFPLSQETVIPIEDAIAEIFVVFLQNGLLWFTNYEIISFGALQFLFHYGNDEALSISLYDRRSTVFKILTRG